jgi:hypothetical protein
MKPAKSSETKSICGNFCVAAGLRSKCNHAEKVNVRVDYGRGQDTSGIYFGIEEAF